MNGTGNKESISAETVPPEEYPPAPLPVWQELQFRNLLARLAEWRSDDHEDAITLCRSEIITIIEGVKAVQNRTLPTD